MRVQFSLNIAWSLLLVALSQTLGASQEKAIKLFEAKCYIEAARIFDEQNREDLPPQTTFRKSLAYLYTSRLPEAYAELQKLESTGFNREEVVYYLARINHLRHQFSIAGEYYKEYLRITGMSSKHRNDVINNLNRLANGLEYSWKDGSGKLEHLLNPVNSLFNELGAVYIQQEERERIYFNSDRRIINTSIEENISCIPVTKIYFAELDDSSGAEIYVYNSGASTDSNERLLGFSPDAETMYYARNSAPGLYQYYQDNTTFRAISLEEKRAFEEFMDGHIGDQDIHILKDGSVIFSSKREGGMGDYDLYFSQKIGDKYEDPRNLGEAVNSPFSEVSPFVSSDGKSIYFSSNSLKSAGGFDVFVSHYDDTKHEWSPAENLGFPLNSAADEMYFRLISDSIALLSSNRAAGYGGFDIFLYHF